MHEVLALFYAKQYSILMNKNNQWIKCVAILWLREWVLSGILSIELFTDLCSTLQQDLPFQNFIVDLIYYLENTFEQSSLLHY